MAYNINSSIDSFEAKFKKFEEETLFNHNIPNPVQNFTSECTRDIGQIFQGAMIQYNALLEGTHIGGDTPDYEAIAARLTQFVKDTHTRTHQEFERKLTKKRHFRAESRNEKWSERRADLTGLVTQVQRNIAALQGSTEAHLGKALKTALPIRTQELRTLNQRLKAVKKEFTALEGSKEELTAKIVQEKERWTVMIDLLEHASKCRKEADPFGKAVQFYCRAGHPRAYPLRNLSPAFHEEKNELEWSISGVQSFGNTLVQHYQEKIEQVKAIQAKYNPQKLLEIREGRCDLSELQKDYSRLCMLIFYLRQMMDVPWERHPLPRTREAFQDFFVKNAPWIDQLRDGLCAPMQHALSTRMKFEEQTYARNLLDNRVPEIKRTRFQRIWDAISSFFRAIASLFRKERY